MQGSDTAGYDEYVEGVEADETSSLQTPLKEVSPLTTSLWFTGARLHAVRCGRAGVLSLLSPHPV